MIRVSAELPSSQATTAGFFLAESRVRMDQVAFPLERIAFYGLLSLIALSAIPYGAVQPWWTALTVCFVFVLVAVRVVEATLRRDWRIAGASMIIPLLALCVFAGIQILPLGALKLGTIDSGNTWQTISTDPLETRRFIFRLLAAVLAGESLLHYTTTRRRLAVLVSVVVGIGVLSAGFGLLRQIAQSDSAGFILPHLAVGQGYGQFINRNHFAFLMEMVLGLLVGFIVTKGDHRGRFLPYLSMALLVWVALVFTNSRGGVISMLGLILFAAITHLVILKWRSTQREESVPGNWLVKYAGPAAIGGVLAIPLVLLIAIGVSWVGGDPMVSRMETVSGELREEDGRLRRKEIWQATLPLITAHPLIGTGFGGYETAIPAFAYGLSGDGSLRQAHNDYLEILAGGGILGAVFATWFIIAVIRKIVPQLRTMDRFRYSTCLGAFAGLFAVSVHSVFDFGLHNTVNALVFTCLIVIATANCSSQPKDSLVSREEL